MTRSVSLFLSPHLDDAVLSCGGLIHRLTSTGAQVVVATIATEDKAPEAPLSWLMKRSHLAWRLGDTPFAFRRGEDIVALQALGANHVHLGMVDAIYRLDSAGAPLYRVSTVGVPPHSEDLERYLPALCSRLAALIGHYGSECVRLFCPLGAGEHVDHLLARRAIECTCAPNQISYYEDFPYASRCHAIGTQSNGIFPTAKWSQTRIDLSVAEVEARISAVSCYGSQLQGLFPSQAERVSEVIRARLPLLAHLLDQHLNLESSRGRMAVALRQYVESVGGERYWYRLSPGHHASTSSEIRADAGWLTPNAYEDVGAVY